MNDTLQGKVALVTGGSRGLGREMVLAFAEAGAAVIIASRKLDACQALAEEVTARFGAAALPVAANVSNWDDCDALVEAAYGRFDRVDVLVNNAGMSPLYPSLDQVSEALYDKVMGVNLKGPFRLTALVGARMAEGGGGSIINISSTAGLVGAPGFTAAYTATKGAVRLFTKSTAVQHAKEGIRCNSVHPGPIATDMIKDVLENKAQLEQRMRRLPMGRVGTPEDVAYGVLFLASDESSFMTGSELVIDGGTTAE
jgi:NAD(P)-dependent dehydrogenase (short-subunit alcohol dehydrogenase family)